MREKRLHDKLKTFLIAVGAKEGYKSFSGDSECLDIRLKRKHIEYQPDVIWKNRTSCHIFEFAFTEDWRAIAGEFTLAWLAGCSSFTIFRLAEGIEGPGGVAFPETERRFFRNLLGVLGEKLGIKWHFFEILGSKLGDSGLERKHILLMLRDKHLITENTFETFFQ